MRFFPLLFFSLSLFAQDEPLSWNRRTSKRNVAQIPSSTKPREKIQKIPTSIVKVGGNYTYAHITPSDSSSFHGHLGGTEAMYEYRSFDALYGSLSFNWKQGNTKGDSGDRFVVLLNGEERIGYTWSLLMHRSSATLYTGVGFRHISHHLKQKGGSVHLSYNDLYIPLGFSFFERVSRNKEIGINFEWMPQVFPTLTIIPLRGARWILNKKFSNFKGELPLFGSSLLKTSPSFLNSSHFSNI